MALGYNENIIKFFMDESRMSRRTRISKCLIVLPFIGLLFSCQSDDSLIQLYIEYLNAERMLGYCIGNGIYNGQGRFRLDITNYNDASIVDDGRLCQAILSSEPTPTALDIQREPADDLTDLITYFVPYDDVAAVVIYADDYLGCEIHPDLSPSYYRYYALTSGKAQELYELAIDIKDSREA